VRDGLKLAFVPPLLSTFFAKDAIAAGSNHSCYGPGHSCESNAEDCCPGLNCTGPQPKTCS
jgi:hypothetical protein